jgi:transposase-like protein
MAEALVTEGSGTALVSRLSAMPAEQRMAILQDSIARYGRGESVYAIAHELGIEHTTLYRHLVKHFESDWIQAKKSRSLAELEDAEESLKTAQDGLALTRARERVRAAQWQLERLYRKIYGQDAQQQLAAAVQININLRGAPMAEKPMESVEGSVLHLNNK